MRRVVWTMALALVAAPVLADRAVPRGGGGGGDRGGGGSDRGSSSSSDRGSSDHGSSSAGERHHGSGSSSTRERSGDHSGSSRAVPRTEAQRRHPRPGTGTGDRWHDGGGYRYRDRYRYGSYGYYWDYGWYDPYYWRWGYSPYYSGGFYGYSPSYYRRARYYRDTGSVRVIVKPERTRVYVDGYYAGIADDFDGIFQRLYLPPGRHDVTLRLEGYRTQHFKVYVPTDGTIKLHYDMVRGEGEATAEQYIGEPHDYARIEDESYRRDRDGEDDEDDDRYGHGARIDRDSRMDRDDRFRREDRGGAVVRLDVRPGNASVYVDGEFHGIGSRLDHLRLSPGRHRIEVVRPGFRTEVREVDVREGDNPEVRIELSRG